MTLLTLSLLAVNAPTRADGVPPACFAALSPYYPESRIPLEVRATLQGAGFRIARFTKAGVAVIDASEPPMGISGVVRNRIARSSPNPDTGLRLEARWIPGEGEHVVGTVVLVLDAQGRTVFAGLPPGFEEANETANQFVVDILKQILQRPR